MATKGIQFTSLSEDRVICEGPCKFWGILVTGRDAGADITVYNGRDATSGTRFHKFMGREDLTLPFLQPEGVRFDGGMFVDVGEDILEATVLWEEAEDPREVGF